MEFTKELLVELLGCTREQVVFSILNNGDLDDAILHMFRELKPIVKGLTKKKVEFALIDLLEQFQADTDDEEEADAVCQLLMEAS